MPTPLRYERSGKKIMHALRYRSYTRVVERVASPLILEFNQAQLLARSVVPRINALVSDTLEVVRSTRDQAEPSAAGRRANVAGAYSARGPVVVRFLLVDDPFTTGARWTRASV